MSKTWKDIARYSAESVAALKAGHRHDHRRDHPCRNWPMESDAAGVHPSQIPEAMEAARRRGVAIEFNKSTGAAIFNSQRHRKDYCEKVRGLGDLNAGFGDPIPPGH